MLKRVLKPGDTHRMASNEEYCRIIYERQWNAPDIFNLHVELYDKGGVRIRQSFQKVSVTDEKTILNEVIGNGWETIFIQDYDDWLVRCQKRPRSSVGDIRYLSPVSDKPSHSVLRNSLVAVLGVGIMAIAVGWILGRQPELLTADRSLEDSEESALELNRDDTDIAGNENWESIDTPVFDDDGGNEAGVLDDESALDRVAEGSDIDIPGTEFGNDLTIGDVLFDDSLDVGSNADDLSLDNDNKPAEESVIEQSTDVDLATIAIAEDDNNTDGIDADSSGAIATTGTVTPDPFVLAVRLAQAAVIDGRIANTQEDWEDLAERWQNAADLMADVSFNDERYDVAQDRVEKYERNRDVALSEADKLD